jgi:signal transduction histidine kinase
MVQWPRAYGMWLLIGVLVLLLGLLAVLQYRWTGEIGRAEAERERARLERSAQRFAGALSREAGRVALVFRPEMPPPGVLDARSRYLSRLEAWRRTERADLVSRVVLVLRSGPDEFLYVACDAGGHEFVPVPPSPALEGVARRLDRVEGGRAVRDGLGLDGLLRDPMSLIVPILEPAPGPPARTGPRGLRPSGAVVVELSASYLSDVLLPELAEVHFGPLDEGDYAVAVLSQPDRAVIYSSDPALGAEEWDRADVRMVLLSPLAWPGPPRERFDRRFGNMLPMEGPGPPDPWSEGVPDEGSGGPPAGRRDPGIPRGERDLGERPAGPRPDTSNPPPAGPGGSPWVLAVRHHGGSLAEAVEAVRRRNLAVGLGVLALLGTAATLLAVGGQRAQHLARQQLDFVAGVTHELHTPLAAIRSAGQNLADGVVADPRQVRRYGDLIQKESGRLNALVAQVLDFAGIESGARAHAAETVALRPLVQKVVAELGLVLEQAGLSVEVDVDDGLPEVRGDEAAIRRALENLLTNASKFAAEGGWVRVQANRRANRRTIAVRVEDRGPGIPRSEQERVFEPFYRGRNAHRTQAPGSGLGLSLVRHVAEAHGGHVRLEPRDEGGMAVVMELPIVEWNEERA